MVTPTTVAHTSVDPTIDAHPATARTTTTTTVAHATVAPTTVACTTIAPTTTIALPDDDEENPFVDLSSQSLGDGQESAVWTSSESELSAPVQNRKEARDVNDFFSFEKGLRYCKYCRYVVCLSAKRLPL
jgi:hypothetical protein